MAKPGRNDRCPCGSGKKYKACCLTKDEAVEHERLAAAQAQRENQAAEKRQSGRVECRAGAHPRRQARRSGGSGPSPAGTIPGRPRRLGSARHGSRKARRKPSSRRLLSKGDRVPRRARIERRVRGPNRKTRPACHRLTSLPTITVRDGPALATTTNQDYRAWSSPRMPWPGLHHSIIRLTRIVDTILIDDQTIDQATELKQRVPIASVTRET